MTQKLIDKLPSVIDRRTVESSLDLARSIMDDTIVKAVESTTELVKASGLKLESRQIQEADKEFKRLYSGSAKNVVDRIGGLTKAVLDSTDTIAKLVSRELPNTLAKEAATYRQLAVLKLVQDVTLYTDYTTSLLTYLMACEMAHAYRVPLTTLTNKASINYVKEQWPAYLNAVEDLTRRAKDIEARVKDTLAIVADDGQTKLLAETHGADKVTPFFFGFIDTKYNFIKTWLSKGAENTANRYHLARSQLDLYQNQLNSIVAIQKRQSTVDPAMRRRTEELTALIELKRYEIEELERSYD